MSHMVRESEARRVFLLSLSFLHNECTREGGEWLVASPLALPRCCTLCERRRYSPGIVLCVAGLAAAPPLLLLALRLPQVDNTLFSSKRCLLCRCESGIRGLGTCVQVGPRDHAAVGGRGPWLWPERFQRWVPGSHAGAGRTAATRYGFISVEFLWFDI